MKQSELVYKTYKEWPADEESKNAKLLIRSGYLEKVASGIYNILPLGWRVINKISNIIRQHLNKIGAQELLLTNLHPKEFWEQTGRWQSFDALFKTRSRLEKEYALAPTHEEIIFPLMKKIINSYRDLPKAVYQIHIKFRDELRAKSGILRTREFIMKDLYSFHESAEDLKKYKELVDETYLKIFHDCGLQAIKTEASGGTFSEFSTEFQVITEAGEDTIYFCYNCRIAFNEEIFSGEKCRYCFNRVEKLKSIEVGNTFELSDKFAEAFDLRFSDKQGKSRIVKTGCYGIGVTRLFGTIVEIWSTENLLWPKNITPFDVHLLILEPEINQEMMILISELEEKFNKEGLEILVDDRENVSFGEKLTESDLLGIPLRVILGKRFKENKEIELLDRINNKTIYLSPEHLLNFVITHE